MGPAQAIRTGLAKSFQFSGRASRSEFWWFAPILVALTGVAATSDFVLNLMPPSFGVLGGILAVLLVVPIPLYSALVRRFRDAGLWPLGPLLIPAYAVTAPLVAVAIDRTVFDIPSRTQGMPELLYAGVGFLALSAGMLALALKPSQIAPITTRE
jgi:uncharacterized membrane protein YhaH (DUF805 family)